jgi:hypothetical protein
MDVLVVRGPMYHSPGDEDAFFWWLKKIRAVSRVRGRGHDLHIELRPGKLTSDELREFRALFHRYGMDTSEIEALSQR